LTLQVLLIRILRLISMPFAMLQKFSHAAFPVLKADASAKSGVTTNFFNTKGGKNENQNIADKRFACGEVQIRDGQPQPNSRQSEPPI
jgi:hypothetical protein